MKEGAHFNPNLKNKAVFTQRDMLFGIPTRVALAAFLLALFVGFVFIRYLPTTIGVLVSILFLFLILVPVYFVHKEDPEAYIVWLRGLFAPSRLSASKSVRRRMLLLSSETSRDGNLRVTQTFKGR